jgi:hypothetical protein
MNWLGTRRVCRKAAARLKLQLNRAGQALGAIEVAFAGAGDGQPFGRGFSPVVLHI